jgi:LPS-assembly protein
LTFGKILSRKPDTDYTLASGLSGQASDLLIGLSAQLPWNLSIASRGIFDPDLTPTKWETRLDLARDRYTLGVVHSYVVADADENRTSDLSELTLDSTIFLKTGWTASADYRYDFEQDQAAFAGFGLEYTNECARVKFGISRRYTDTQSIDPTTNYSISVGFGAFGNQRSSAQGTCGL